MDINAGGLVAEYINMFLKLKKNDLATLPWFKVKKRKTHIVVFRRAEGNGLQNSSISKMCGNELG